MEANMDSTATRFAWGVAVIIVTVARLAGVAHSVITDPTGDVTFSGARPGSVNVVAGGLGLPGFPGGTVVAPIAVTNRFLQVERLTFNAEPVG